MINPELMNSTIGFVAPANNLVGYERDSLLVELLTLWLVSNDDSLSPLSFRLSGSSLPNTLSIFSAFLGVEAFLDLEHSISLKISFFSFGQLFLSRGWTSFDFYVLASDEEEVLQSDPFPDAGITDEERRRFRELQASPEYKCIERNMAKCEERVQLIVDKANRVLTNRGIQIRDPEDIERGVNIYLTDIWEKEPTTRLSALKRILNADENPRSRVWEKIIKEIKKLDGSSSD